VSRRNRLLSLSLLLTGAAVFPSLAAAAVSCVASSTSTAFGIYNPLSATPTYANGDVQVTCTLLSGGATTLNLVSSYGTGASGTYTMRTMISGANKLNYNLFFDAAYTSIRGNGTGGSATGGATLNLTPANPTGTASGTIYGRIPAGQDVAAGSYADTIVVTITY
jgi:spore coat protein U-like protein